MEDYCDKHFPTWKSMTPRDWLYKFFATNDIKHINFNGAITCSWGTLHCDAARCQKYLCSDDWKRRLDTFSAAATDSAELLTLPPRVIFGSDTIELVSSADLAEPLS